MIIFHVKKHFFTDEIQFGIHIFPTFVLIVVQFLTKNLFEMKRLVFGLVACISLMALSCEPNSTAEEDQLYDNQTIDRTKVKIPTNGIDRTKVKIPTNG